MSQTVRGEVQFSTSGVEKLKAADAAMNGLVGQQTRVVKSTGAMAEVQRMGGERMARYATSIALLSGQMQRAGIQNEMVARGFSIITEGAMGMLGPIGLATIAVSGLATVVLTLTNRQKENERISKENAKSLLEYASRFGIHGEIQRILLGDMETAAQAELVRLQADREHYAQALKQGWLVTPWGTERAVTGGLLADVKRRAGETELALIQVQQRLAAIRSAYMGGTEAPFVGPPTPGAGGTGGGGGGKTAGAVNEWAKYAYGLGGLRSMSIRRAGVLGIGGPEALDPWAGMGDRYRSETEIIAEATASMVAETGRLYEIMGSDALAAFRGLSAGGAAAMTGLTKLVAQNLETQGKAHLKLKDVGEYAVRELVATSLDALAKKYMAEAAGYAALALGHLAYGNFGLSGEAAAAAAAYTAAAAAAGGAAMAFRSAGERHYGSASGDGGRGYYSDVNDYGPNGYERQRSPGVSMYEAGAAPTTINYNVTTIFQGPTVFGDDGMREFSERLIPYIREANEAGRLN